MSTILILDDEDLIRWSLRQHLSSMGHRVLDASTASGGLELLQAEERVDLVLLDLKLPDGDGLTVLEEIGHLRPACHVILMTAFWASDAAERAKRLGAYAVISKPFNLTTLGRQVDAALGRAS